MSTIFDEYIRYWINGVCLSNQVNGSTSAWAKKAPGTQIRVKELIDDFDVFGLLVL